MSIRDATGSLIDGIESALDEWIVFKGPITPAH